MTSHRHERLEEPEEAYDREQERSFDIKCVIENVIETLSAPKPLAPNVSKHPRLKLDSLQVWAWDLRQVQTICLTPTPNSKSISLSFRRPCLNSAHEPKILAKSQTTGAPTQSRRFHSLFVRESRSHHLHEQPRIGPPGGFASMIRVRERPG